MYKIRTKNLLIKNYLLLQILLEFLIPSSSRLASALSPSISNQAFILKPPFTVTGITGLKLFKNSIYHVEKKRKEETKKITQLEIHI